MASLSRMTEESSESLWKPFEGSDSTHWSDYVNVGALEKPLTAQELFAKKQEVKKVGSSIRFPEHLSDPQIQRSSESYLVPVPFKASRGSQPGSLRKIIKEFQSSVGSKSPSHSSQSAQPHAPLTSDIKEV
jgi:hypothetical protein